MKQCRVRSQPSVWDEGSGAAEWWLVSHLLRALGCGKEGRAPTPVRCRVFPGAPFWPHGKGCHPCSGWGLLPPGNVLCGPDKEVVLKALSQTMGTAGTHF